MYLRRLENEELNSVNESNLIDIGELGNDILIKKYVLDDLNNKSVIKLNENVGLILYNNSTVLDYKYMSGIYEIVNK